MSPLGVDLAPGVPHVAGRTGEVAWDRYGDGPGVPLLLLHGVTDSGLCWAPVLGDWADDRVVVTLDARGHGRTPLGPAPFTIAALASDAAAVARDVLGRPALVVGHSMGGLTAQDLALQAPDVVAGLVLEDPAWGAHGDVDGRGVPPWLPDALASWGAATPEELLAGSRRDEPTWSGAEHVSWALAHSQVDPHLADGVHRWHERDWPTAFGSDADVAVTLVTGDPARGAMVTDALVAQAQAVLGERLTRVHVPGAGHCVRRDAPAAVVDAVRAAATAADAARG